MRYLTTMIFSSIIVFSAIIYVSIRAPHQYVYFCSTIKQDKLTYEVTRDFRVITTNHKITTAEEIQGYLRMDEAPISFNLLTTD